MAGMVVLGTALAIMWRTATALAGTPFGGDDPGFVPPTQDVLECEDTGNRNISRDFQCLIRCHLEAGERMLNGQAFDDEPCEERCSKAFVRAAAALFARNICPPCYCGGQPCGRFTQADLEMFAKSNEQTVDSAGGAVACAGTTPIGGDDAGFVAPDRATGECQLAVGKHISKFLRALFACHRKQADAAFNHRSFDEEGCEDVAKEKYDAANANLTGCPSCLDAKGFGAAIRAMEPGSGYPCSGSGAFLDGVN